MDEVRCPRCQRNHTLTGGACPDSAPSEPGGSESNSGEERLGGYRLLRVLGEGGMARVYLAKHEKLGRLCAIKRLHPAHFEDRLTVSRFLAEARAISGIRHPNLVGIYDVIEEPGEVCLVMEYLEGRDLGQVLREHGPLGPERIASLCAQACEALDAVHAHGIVHRDLKPDNLFLVREPNGRERIKLLDFGVARLDEERPPALRTRSGQTVGTPQYMSPEQATATDIDARSDIYMMGVVMFELATGRAPFRGKSYGDVMMMHVHDPPPRPSSLRLGVPPWLETVILRCLEKSPDRRYQSARELAAALKRDATVKISVMDGPPEPIKHGSSNLTWLAVLGGALIFAVVIAVVIAVRTTRLRSPALAPRTADEPFALPAVDDDPEEAKVARRLWVRTTPVGAAIQVDGSLRCLSPCEISLSSDTSAPLAVVVSAPDYQEERRLIDVHSPPAELNLVLRRREPVRH